MNSEQASFAAAVFGTDWERFVSCNATESSWRHRWLMGWLLPEVWQWMTDGCTS